MKYSYEETKKAEFARVHFSDKYLYLPGAIKNIDFCIMSPIDSKWILWAEAKAKSVPLIKMFTQLVITIAKAQINHDNVPNYVAVFDKHRICFIPYHIVKELLSLNVDWNNLIPSNSNSIEFKNFQNNTIHTRFYTKESIIFELYETDNINQFIKNNLIT